MLYSAMPATRDTRADESYMIDTMFIIRAIEAMRHDGTPHIA